MNDTQDTIYQLRIDTDQQGMALALIQAGFGMLSTNPNPRVGAVITRQQRVIGVGFTQPPGGNHAEIQALADAAMRGEDVRGATIYVTLEPCSHFGRTPPCADALIRAGIGRVVAAITDPNPLVAGQGLAKLQAAGIETASGVLQDEAAEINIGFLKRMRTGLPWVRMKTAASLDGKTALNNGSSQWITSQAARDDGHIWRARACAIMAGIGTIAKDDAQLTVRAIDTPRQPHRIVVDSKLAVSPQARVIEGGGTWVFTASEDRDKRAALEDKGAEVIVLANAEGKVDLPALLRELGQRQVNELHVEAGSKLNASLIREGCVDELLAYLAPCLLGEGRNMFDLPPLQDLQGRIGLHFHEVKQIGPDLRILARFD
ncbi:bifunctional diaminohydroxyphosphoribosylaminopyrimidine deaminase/5-amino-6-(5-phosphoribosylamino)uracil reductase RibD [Herbaspirillum sp. YR522]|uniref:bifunctional diaminohydroxyphosphoribosylaminopyrimidine deaminase/5-amino-6-(5-phosphoribosylamino)uracil reductase RibD n=1 Tax=Herbaspirillum sp. YR522 TaxID=1144342 RepID=UPI00026F7F07|nr:bifunctional diaminohydroxyphosphoribosylaminopyrimidine deaminase/5-amino-6-(5-phosphoribosylamino)uracil reductase RibD [Herbaspirillum sp. YR522]EJN10040.1 riboflavin biosynthesis protein RibD [Herbaspirillum sp. YR522]